MFLDRQEAGRQLGRRLLSLEEAGNVVVVALPRGGVPVALEVAALLEAPLDVRIARKLRATTDPELAIGAVNENGEVLSDPALLREMGIPAMHLRTEIRLQRDEIRSRDALLRQFLPRQSLEGHCVVLVDDGLATGFTMEAAVRGVQAEGARCVIVATPVGAPATVQRLAHTADEVICLKMPPHFEAVGQFYQHFDQLDDDTIVQMLERFAAPMPQPQRR